MKNLGSSLLVALAITINTAYSQQLQLGGSIDVYHGYGNLGKTIKVMPMGDDSPSGFFHEHSINVVRDPVPVPKVQQPQNFPRLLNGHVQMELCDSIDKLPKSYFRGFQIEGVEEPWRAFDADWSNKSIAKRFGFSETYAGSNYSYILLKYEGFRGGDRLAASPQDVEATDAVAKEIARIDKNDVIGLMGFFEHFGSHYISAYTTGNALYQVFVYKRSDYESIKNTILRRGLFQISLHELSIYFSPYIAVQVGEIQSASGNHSNDAWIAEKLRGRHTNFQYTSLLKMHRNPLLMEELGTVLHNEAVLRMQLRTITSLVRDDPAKREWFEQWINVPVVAANPLEKSLVRGSRMAEHALVNHRLAKGLRIF